MNMTSKRFFNFVFSTCLLAIFLLASRCSSIEDNDLKERFTKEVAEKAILCNDSSFFKVQELECLRSFGWNTFLVIKENMDQADVGKELLGLDWPSDIIQDQHNRYLFVKNKRIVKYFDIYTPTKNWYYTYNCMDTISREGGWRVWTYVDQKTTKFNILKKPYSFATTSYILYPRSCRSEQEARQDLAKYLDCDTTYLKE